MTLRLQMLPARDGDCLLLSWGEGRRLSHMVVDGGRSAAYSSLRKCLTEIATASEELELYILTHIDADHIEGALSYINDLDRPLEPKQVWFNGYEDLSRPGFRSYAQGDKYSAGIKRVGWRLNPGFTDNVVSVETAPPHLEVSGLAITLLSPYAARLEAIRKGWADWRVRREAEHSSARTGVRSRSSMPVRLIVEDLARDGPTDVELPNGSSIAFIAEWRGKRILFGGDAHPDALAVALSPLAAREGGRVRIDLLKLSHHGSQKNTSRELIRLLDCRRFAISTNGAIHGHPDPEAIARARAFGSEGHKILYFNYKTARTSPWAADELMTQHNYECKWPEGEAGYLVIDVENG